MIKHIVIWRLQDHAAGNDKATNAKLIKSKLEALNGVIPGLISLEVGIDFLASPASGDAVLYSELTSREALDHYQTHPAHVEAVEFVKTVISDRVVVDYEV